MELSSTTFGSTNRAKGDYSVFNGYRDHQQVWSVDHWSIQRYHLYTKAKQVGLNRAGFWIVGNGIILSSRNTPRQYSTMEPFTAKSAYHPARIW